MKKLYFMAVFLFLVSIAYLLVDYYKSETEKEYLAKKTEAIYLDYKVIYNKHKDMADILYKTQIEQPEIINLFKNRERDLLQERLLKNYEKLRAFSIRQVHFHLPNNDSFLRMHRPSRYGDNLSKDRLTVKYVNEHLKPIDGFEEGKVFNGFRFVYPMFDGDEHIGSVEISFSALSFIKDIVKHYKVMSNFHIDKRVVESKVFKDEQSNYVQSPLTQFYCQKSILEYTGIDLSTKKRTKEQITDIYKSIQKGVPFSKLFMDIEEVITFIPLKNPITNKVTAVLTHRGDNMILAKNSSYSKIIFLITVLVIGVSLLLLYKEIEYKQNLEEDVKKKTQEIKKSIQLLNNVIKGSNLGYWDWYPQTKEHIVNDRWLEMLGLDRDDITNTESDWSNRVHPDDAKLIMPVIMDSIKKDIPYRVEFRMRHKDGHYVWIQGSGAVVDRDSSNRATRLSGTHSDISSEVQLKKDKELHMQQLLQQSRLAQMGEMISMIAHQWRQPLGSIATVAANLQMKIELKELDLDLKDGKYLTDRLKKIDNYVQNLTITIDEFRDFYKPNEQSVEVKLDELLKRVLNVTNASLEGDNIEIIEQYSVSDRVEVYDSEVMQVILNILKNAQDNFKEKETSNPKIIIKTGNKSISICDNGGGVPEDVIEKIFDPYYSTKSEKNGTGLGLYMSKVIIEEHHNGRLSVVNKDGGACFSIELGDI
ncbi:MAG: PAS domain-containing protein [Campylobacterota bacterium]